MREKRFDVEFRGSRHLTFSRERVFSSFLSSDLLDSNPTTQSSVSGFFPHSQKRNAPFPSCSIKGKKKKTIIQCFHRRRPNAPAVLFQVPTPTSAVTPKNTASTTPKLSLAGS